MHLSHSISLLLLFQLLGLGFLTMPGCNLGRQESNQSGYPLDVVTRSISGRAQRASSGLFDPESNADCYHVRPGQTLTLAELDGPGEIRHIWFTLMSRDRRYPRNMVLRIYWDHSPIPAVESPIGDFFAAGNGMRANVSCLPIEVTSYGRAKNSYWRMPFRKHAKVTIENESQERTSVYFQCDWLKLDSLAPDTLYFHARYKQDYPPKPFQVYTVFNGTGKGQYVGTVLSSQNTVGSWFGESDDRFYIDGETSPSLVGTGLEDYFNDGWNLRLFSTLRRGVTICENKGEERRITAFRWHLEDPVPFKESLKLEIERRSFMYIVDPQTGKRLVNPESKSSIFDFKYRPDYFSSVAFWYHDGVAPRFWDFPKGPERLLHEVFLHVQEPSYIKKIKASPGARAERYSNRTCNLKKGLRLRNDQVGGWCEFPVKITEHGRYSISIWQSLFITNGTWKVSLHGPGIDRELHPGMDFTDPFYARNENWPENYHHGTINIAKPSVGYTRTHILKPGDYRLRFECVGSNPSSRNSETGEFGQGYDLTLDLITFRKIPITDTVKWTKDYLKAEKALFTGRIKRAKKMVDQLSHCVEQYYTDKGTYPADLTDLCPGYWPKSHLPLDPWGQKYLIQVPGKINVTSYDLYSRHGHARSPSRWIGNWSYPYRLKGALEGEDLRRVKASPGASSSRQRLSVRHSAPVSNDRILFIRLNSQGDTADFSLPKKFKPGKYKVSLLAITSWDYGQVQWSLAGQPINGVIDGYTPKIDRLALTPTIITIGAAPPILRVKVMGRNQNSAGYLAGLDALFIEPVR